MIGKLLGNRYEILNKIGEGGMAFVYTAKCTLLDRIVAIKILKPEFAKDEEFLEKFKNEAQSAARVNHPNIVNVYDVGQDGDYSYIVMEYVDGENLKDLIRNNGKLSEEDSLDIAIQIAGALKVAHSKGIIHRDIKSHNIMMTSNNIVKVGDFGIAKAVSSATITAVGSIMGSVHYFSPEQARGGYVDERSDMYSLGIVLFEMLTGHVPFDGESPVNIALKQIQDPIKFLPEENIREDIRVFVTKITAKSPDRRFKDIGEVVEKIEDLKGAKESTSKKSGITEISSSTMEATIHRDEKFSSTLAEVEKKEVKSSGKLKTTLLAVVLALIFSTVGGFLFVFYGGFDVITNLFSNEKIVLEDFRGMTLEEAEKEARNLGIEIVQDGTEVNNNYEDGTIASQYPEKGVKVDSGSVVKVILSIAGAVDVQVPSLIGHTEEEAVKELEKLGLNGSIKTEVSEGEAGVVILQAPVADTVIKTGDTVQIIVSIKAEGDEAKNTPVPSVVGLSLDEARRLLSQFTLTESYREDKTKSSDEILSQNPEGGTLVEENGAVSIVINRVEKKPTVSQSLQVILPTDTDELNVKIEDKSSGDVIYEEVINPNSNDGVLKVVITGEQEETKVYSISINGKHLADQEVTF